MMSRISPFCLSILLALALAIVAPAARAQSQSAAMFRGLGMLGSGAPLTRVTASAPAATKAVIAQQKLSSQPRILNQKAFANKKGAAHQKRVASQNRVASAAVTTGSQNLSGPLQFSFSGYSAAQRSVLQNFVNANYANMVSVYGAPAPEQAGKTVSVEFEARASAYIPPLPGGATGGTIVFGYNDTTTNAVNTYNFTRLALIAFQGPRVPAFNFRAGNYVEPWLYGMADAAALQVAYLAGGSRADFNPSSVSTYALSIYDYLNRPELGNAYIYSRSERENELAISFFRAAMAQSAFLKVAVENPRFFAEFNARLYARGAAGASISPDQLKSIAASVTPVVEGRAFNDWVRAQYALDATVTTGQKLYLLVLPLAAGATGNNVPSATVIAQAFVTNSDGSETASSGYGSLRAYDEGGRDISSQSSDLVSSNVLSFNNADRPGEAEAVVGFGGLSDANRALITLKARFKQAEATNYVPYGAAGNATSTSSYFGGTLGGQNGPLQISGSANQTVAVTRGTWAATAPYPSGPRVQTAFTFGGATVRRNTAWLAPGPTARSAAFLLEGPANVQTLNFSTPAGQSPLRMVSLPGFPLETDEAAALNIAPSALKLARYRPNLSPATLDSTGALQFGIGGDRYEIYPNISTPIAPGRGYWLGVGQNGYSTTVRASSPPANKAYEVPLQGGWNQIGVPFNRTFSPAAIRVRYGGFAPVALALAQTRGWVAPGIWRWRPEGGYVRADVGDAPLAPFEGYFIFAGLPNGVALVFDPSASAVANMARVEAGSWSVNLRAVGATTDDVAGRFGVSSAPNIAKPPAGARVVSLRFEGSDAQGASATGSGLAESYAPQLGEGASWTAIVDGTATGEKVTLKWGNFEGNARYVALTLLDHATGESVAMKSGASYAFVATNVPRRLTISAKLAPLNPKLAPSLSPAAVGTADVLTALANASGFAPDAPLVYLYRWRNGERVLDETSASLDLSAAGHGNRGDEISVEVTARDAQGRQASGTASVVVGNTAPLLSGGTLNVESGASGSVTLSSSDADGDEISLAVLRGPVRGVAEVRKVHGQWMLFYTSPQKASGSDAVQVVASDGFGGSSSALVRINIRPDEASNGAPVALDGAIESARSESATAILQASDPDGDALTFRLVRGAQFGNSEIAIDPADGKWKLFTRNLRAPAHNADSVQFVAVDALGKKSNVATISIRFRNRQPSANNLNARVSSGAEIAIALSGSDPDGDALRFKRVGGPGNGTGEVRRDKDGVWKLFYRSRAGWSGTETVRYVALDESGRSSVPATLSITVTGNILRPWPKKSGSWRPNPSAGAS